MQRSDRVVERRSGARTSETLCISKRPYFLLRSTLHGLLVNPAW